MKEQSRTASRLQNAPWKTSHLGAAQEEKGRRALMTGHPDRSFRDNVLKYSINIGYGIFNCAG
jgi:hypothetical protein